MHLMPPVASAAVSSKVVVLFIATPNCLWGFCVWSLFCYSILCVLPSFAEEKAGYLTVFLMSCAVSVLCLFFTLLWIGMQCVIVVFPDHTHFFFKSYVPAQTVCKGYQQCYM